MGEVLTGPVITALLDDRPKARREAALAPQSLINPCVIVSL